MAQKKSVMLLFTSLDLSTYWFVCSSIRFEEHKHCLTSSVWMSDTELCWSVAHSEVSERDMRSRCSLKPGFSMNITSLTSASLWHYKATSSQSYSPWDWKPRYRPDVDRRSSTPQCCHAWFSDPLPAPRRTRGCLWAAGEWSRAPGMHLRKKGGELLWNVQLSSVSIRNLYWWRTKTHCKTADCQMVCTFYFWNRFTTDLFSVPFFLSFFCSSHVWATVDPHVWFNALSELSSTAERRRHSERTSHVQFCWRQRMQGRHGDKTLQSQTGSACTAESRLNAVTLDSFTNWRWHCDSCGVYYLDSQETTAVSACVHGSLRSGSSLLRHSFLRPNKWLYMHVCVCLYVYDVWEWVGGWVGVFSCFEPCRARCGT